MTLFMIFSLYFIWDRRAFARFLYHLWCDVNARDRRILREVSLAAKRPLLMRMLPVRLGHMFLAGGARFGPKRREKLVAGQRIDDVLFLEPAAPRHGHAVTNEREVRCAVRVSGYDHFHAALLAHPQINILQIQPVGI